MLGVGTAPFGVILFYKFMGCVRTRFVIINCLGKKKIMPLILVYFEKTTRKFLFYFYA